MESDGYPTVSPGDASPDIVLPPNTEQDGVAAMHDTEAEAGDEQEITDDFDLDHREARELGVALDEVDNPEAGLS